MSLTPRSSSAWHNLYDCVVQTLDHCMDPSSSQLNNGHIMANKPNFEKISPLSFLKFFKLEKTKCLYFCVFWLIYQDMVILWILATYCIKSLICNIFPHILTEEENFVKNWLYSLLFQHNLTLWLKLIFMMGQNFALLTLNYRAVLTMSQNCKILTI